MLEIAEKILVESWSVLSQMAPWLLLGFLVAGVLSVCISPAWIERHLGSRGFLPVLKASLFGVPLPLCSCGVIPVAASMRRHGASRAATVSFLLSTPQTGVDSIAATYAVLGPVLAIFRPIIAMLTGLVGGGLVLLLGDPDDPREGGLAAAPRESCAEACCAGPKRRNPVTAALHYGLVTLPRDILGALILGTIIAGTISALVPQHALEPYLGGGIVAILLMMAIGVPVYVCATGSVPIAAGFLYLGASPGAVLAFLISGPATNAATITTVWRILGRRTALVYLATIGIVAVTAGLLLDWLFASLVSIVPQAMTGAGCHGTLGWWDHLGAVVLLGVMAVSYFAARGQRRREEPKQAATPKAAEGERVELEISGLTCGHCQAVATEAIKACPGVATVEVTLKPGRAVITGQGLDAAVLVEAIRQVGFWASPCRSGTGSSEP